MSLLHGVVPNGEASKTADNEKAEYLDDWHRG